MPTGWGTPHVRIWIDYNDDFNFTLDELILDNYTIADGAGSEWIWFRLKQLLYI